MRDVGQGRDTLAHYTPVGRDIAGAHLQEIIEAAGNHVALLDLRNGEYSLVEVVERGRPCVGQRDLNESNVAFTHFLTVDYRTVTAYVTLGFEIAEPGLNRGFRQPDFLGEGGEGKPAVPLKLRKDGFIEAVQLICIHQKIVLIVPNT